MPNMVTVREAVKRAREDGFPISEYTLRQWIRCGEIPVRKAGTKILIFYPTAGTEAAGDNAVLAGTESPGDNIGYYRAGFVFNSEGGVMEVSVHHGKGNEGKWNGSCKADSPGLARG